MFEQYNRKVKQISVNFLLIHKAYLTVNHTIFAEYFTTRYIMLLSSKYDIKHTSFHAVAQGEFKK